MCVRVPRALCLRSRGNGEDRHTGTAGNKKVTRLEDRRTDARTHSRTYGEKKSFDDTRGTVSI